MASGDTADLKRRLQAVLPAWFGDNPPVIGGILTGLATTWSWGYDLVAFTKRQTRIATASDGWLDLISWDFLGAILPRYTRETDDKFRARILPEILRERATRKGIAKGLKDMTGVEPIIIELWNPYDVLCYDTPETGGYDVGAVYGSYDYTAQFLVRAYRPQGEGIPYIYGYDTFGGYDSPGYSVLVDPTDVVGAITDAAIYARTYALLASGTTAWVQINTGAPVGLQEFIFATGLDYTKPSSSGYLPGLDA